MIIIRLMGGLGNQLQQYALYRKFLSLGKEAKLDSSWFDDGTAQKVLAPRRLELTYFKGLPMEFCTDEEREALLGRGSRAVKFLRKVERKLSDEDHSDEDHPETGSGDWEASEKERPENTVERSGETSGAGRSASDGASENAEPYEEAEDTAEPVEDRIGQAVLSSARKFLLKEDQKLLVRLGGTSYVREVEEMYDPEIFDLDKAYLIGYFACNKYYADVLPEIRKDIVFPVNPDPDAAVKNRSTMEQMAREQVGTSPVSVSVHYRRGDYLDPSNSFLTGICTAEYYDGAVDYLRQQFPDRPFHFYIFSDDTDFAREHPLGEEGEENTVVDWNTGDSSLLDMQLMSCCAANICANSTFSFWGARLNPHGSAVRIRPSTHRTTQTETPELMHDYWRGWTLVDPMGEVF